MPEVHLWVNMSSLKVKLSRSSVCCKRAVLFPVLMPRHRGRLPADEVRLVVLDEADKMLSLGFEPQLTRLRRRLCPPQSRRHQLTSGHRWGRSCQCNSRSMSHVPRCSAMRTRIRR